MKEIRKDEIVLDVFFDFLAEKDFQICRDRTEPHHPADYEEAGRQDVLRAYRFFRARLMKTLLEEKRALAAKAELTPRERDRLADLDRRCELFLPQVPPSAEAIDRMRSIAKKALEKNA